MSELERAKAVLEFLEDKQVWSDVGVDLAADDFFGRLAQWVDENDLPEFYINRGD